jgi:hypothetical protein
LDTRTLVMSWKCPLRETTFLILKNLWDVLHGTTCSLGLLKNPIIIVLEVHCDIYKSACYLRFTPPRHSPQKSLNRSHFSIFTREYIILLPYSPSYTLSTGTNPQTWPALPSCAPFL